MIPEAPDDTYIVHVNERCRRKKEASKAIQTTKQSNTTHPRHVHVCTRHVHVYTRYMYMYVHGDQGHSS